MVSVTVGRGTNRGTVSWTPAYTQKRSLCLLCSDNVIRLCIDDKNGTVSSVRENVCPKT